MRFEEIQSKYRVFLIRRCELAKRNGYDEVNTLKIKQTPRQIGRSKTDYTFLIVRIQITHYE